MDIYNSDEGVRKVLIQLVNGTYSPDNTELFRELYDALLTERYGRPDQFFILKDFRSYVEAQEEVAKAYADKKRWAKMAMTNIAQVGKFSSDRTIEEYAKDIWKLKKVKVIM